MLVERGVTLGPLLFDLTMYAAIARPWPQAVEDGTETVLDWPGGLVASCEDAFDVRPAMTQSVRVSARQGTL